MALSAGIDLGPYEILSAVGAGGMGEIYKARDTRLDRTSPSKSCPAGSTNVPNCVNASSAKRALSQA
jgi:serine/threonine protein kinase